MSTLTGVAVPAGSNAWTVRLFERIQPRHEGGKRQGGVDRSEQVRIFNRRDIRIQHDFLEFRSLEEVIGRDNDWAIVARPQEINVVLDLVIVDTAEIAGASHKEFDDSPRLNVAGFCFAQTQEAEQELEYSAQVAAPAQESRDLAAL